MRILIVEDYPELGPALAALLTVRGGHQTTHVETCAAAIAAIAQADASGQPFQVIVAAVYVHDGFTMNVCRQLEERVKSGVLRFVAMSGWWHLLRNQPSRGYFTGLGVVKLLHKAVRPAELCQAVEGK